MVKTMQIGYVLSEQVGDVWDRVIGWVDEVCDVSNGRSTPAETLDQCLKGMAQLWIAFDPDTMEPYGYAVSRIVEYPKLRMLLVEQLGGKEFDAWEYPIHDALVKMAQFNDCNGLELWGRKGWVRKMTKHGWEAPFVTAQLLFDQEDMDEQEFHSNI